MSNSFKAVSQKLPWLALIACIGIFGFSLTPGVSSLYQKLGIFFSGIIPLVVYHYYLNNQKDSSSERISLTDAEVDSIYYFGFVITLITLIAAVFTVGLSENKSIDPFTIGLQFGLGLLATGYALIARLQLQKKNEAMIDVEAAYANYLDRVNGLLGRVDKAYNDLDELMIRIVDKLRKTLEVEASENTSRLTRQVEQSFSPLLEACKLLALQIGNGGLGTEIEAMRAIVANSNKTIKTFDSRLQILSDQVSSSSSPLFELGKALVECQRGGECLSLILNNLSIDPNLSQNFSNSVNAIGKSLLIVSSSVSKLENEFGDNSVKATQAFTKFNEDLLSSTNILTQSMIHLATAIAQSSMTLNNSLNSVINDASTQ